MCPGVRASQSEARLLNASVKGQDGIVYCDDSVTKEKYIIDQLLPCAHSQGKMTVPDTICNTSR